MEVKWIKIVTDLFDDEKILLIEALPEADQVIVVWLKLLCLAGKVNNDGMIIFNEKMPYTDEMLATIFRRKLSTIRLALETFEKLGMVEIIKNTICIPNWEKHQNVEGLEKIREQRKIRQQKYRKNHKLLNNNVDVTLHNGTEEDREEDKEEEKNILFETFWDLYDMRKARADCEAYWNGDKPLKTKKYITNEEREICIKKLPAYVNNTNKDGTYPTRKDPKTYLYNSSWNDEIITKQDTSGKPVEAV